MGDYERINYSDMKRTLLYISLFIFIFFVGTGSMSAMVYNGTPHMMTQPNGDSITVYLYGTDLYIDAESEDHYTLTKDEKSGEICYAMLSKDGKEYASTGIVYKGGETPSEVKAILQPRLRISKESRSEKIKRTRAKLNKPETSQEGPVLRVANALPDTIYGLCVIIDFPSTKSSVSRDQIEVFLNGDNNPIFGNKCSIKEYFHWISNGKLTYINFVPDQFYTAEKEYSDYAPVTATEYTVGQFYPQVQNAINAWGEAHPDKLQKLTANEYNGIKALNILYAGKCNNEWGTGLWPHQSYVSNFDEVKVKDWRYRGFNIYHSYQMTDIGSKLTMGTFVHENGHLICGWPDFYQYEEHEPNNASYYNIGDAFSISSETNPPYPNPWALDQMGWLDHQTDITDIKDGRVINLQKGRGYAAVYRGSGNNFKDKYYLEIRDVHYLHNRIHRETGIFIWHSYDDGDNCYPDKEELLECRPAQYEHPFWKKGNGPDVFNDDSDPSAKWRGDEKSGIYLWDFSEGGDVMTFRCGHYIEKPEFVTEALSKAIINRNYTDSIILQGGDAPYVIDIYDGDLPEGLELSASGVIHGIPTQAGETTFSLKVTDSKGKTAFHEFTLVVYESTPLNGTPYTIPGTFQMEGYDRGGAEVAFYTTRTVDARQIKDARDDNEYFPMVQVNESNYAIDFLNAGEWVQYTVDVQKSGIYNMEIQNETIADAILSLTIDQKVADTMMIPALYKQEKKWFFTTTKAVSKSSSKEIHLEKGVHKIQFVGESLSTNLQMDSTRFTLIKEDILTDNYNTPNERIQVSRDGKGEFILSGAQAGETIYVYNPQGELLDILEGAAEIRFGAKYRMGVYFIQIVGKESTFTIKVIKN